MVDVRANIKSCDRSVDTMMRRFCLTNIWKPANICASVIHVGFQLWDWNCVFLTDGSEKKGWTNCFSFPVVDIYNVDVRDNVSACHEKRVVY